MENYRIIRSDNELYHFGVKGMKWGVRRARKNDGSGSDKPKIKRSERKYYNKDGTLNTTGKQREIGKTRDTERKASIEKYREAKKSATNRAERKEARRAFKEEGKEIRNRYIDAIDKTYHKDYTPTARALDTFNYGEKTTNRINDRMINKGDSYKKALHKELASQAAVGMAISAMPYVANAAVKSIKKYANTRAQQKANAGLARIGTYKLEHLGQNVYREVMR